MSACLDCARSGANYVCIGGDCVCVGMDYVCWYVCIVSVKGWIVCL